MSRIILSVLIRGFRGIPGFSTPVYFRAIFNFFLKTLWVQKPLKIPKTPNLRPITLACSHFLGEPRSYRSHPQKNSSTPNELFLRYGGGTVRARLPRRRLVVYGVSPGSGPLGVSWAKEGRRLYNLRLGGHAVKNLIYSIKTTISKLKKREKNG